MIAMFEKKSCLQQFSGWQPYLWALNILRIGHVYKLWLIIVASFIYCVDDEIDVTNVPFGTLKVKDRLYVFMWIILSYHQVFFCFLSVNHFIVYW